MTTQDERSDFAPRARGFLTDLAAHNDRDWFRAEKPRYDAEVRRPAEHLVARVATALAGQTHSTVRAKLFRLHRDVRRSEDKTPFYTHLHASWTPPDGHAWYFGLSPEYAAAGTGVMQFDNAQARDWARAIDGPQGDALAALLHDLNARLDPPELDAPPEPFACDHPHADLLRRTGCVVWIDGLYGALCDDPEAALLTAFDRLAPIHDWLDRAL
ncbi:hypothetical protein AL036_20380 [Salipiger aestuarii]|uniref:TIGR02453 family protein n=1 Tax=Salipiger aestuarii TaxID=568098 RepID=UPI00025B65A5|nr:TIGR02453 family protein [Salipiger aestuarii]EIE49082.1 hypothetical protein C357_20677 [Citreicella sp. 357]KAA8605165.1 hypothetical protein AL036_20380 [Salipiger aestuarii]